MAPTELLIWLLVIVAGLTVLGLISYLIGRLVHAGKQGRTASGPPVKESPVTVLQVRKLGSAEECRAALEASGRQTSYCATSTQDMAGGG